MLDEELDAMLKEYEEAKDNEEKEYQKKLLEREERWGAWTKENNATLLELVELLKRCEQFMSNGKGKFHYLVPETLWAFFLPSDGEVGLGLQTYLNTTDQLLHYLVLFPNTNSAYPPRVYKVGIDATWGNNPDKFHHIDTCTLIADDAWWRRICRYMEDFDNICEQACKWMKGELKGFKRSDV